jgi:hypothetical protein
MSLAEYAFQRIIWTIRRLLKALYLTYTQVQEVLDHRRDRVWDNPYTKTTARESILELQLRHELTSPLRT